jgi:hypothetical protein
MPLRLRNNLRQLVGQSISPYMKNAIQKGGIYCVRNYVLLKKGASQSTSHPKEGNYNEVREYIVMRKSTKIS